MGLREKLEELRQQGTEGIKGSSNLKSINQIRVKFLGKKGPITNVLRGMKDLSPEERPQVGKYANQVRDELQKLMDQKREEIEKERLH